MQHHSPHSPRCSARSCCSSALRLLSASQVKLSSSQIRPNPGISVQGCPAQAEQTLVCETLRWQLYQVLSSDKTQRYWLQINSCSECFPSSQTWTRLLLEWAKDPLHSYWFRSSVLQGPELPWCWCAAKLGGLGRLQAPVSVIQVCTPWGHQSATERNERMRFTC